MLPKTYIGKRSLDIILVVMGLVCLSPVVLFVFALVRFKLGRPVFFNPVRAGYEGREFVLYKFRTMTEKRDSNGQLLPDEERITPFGNILRNFSLDELPSLFNVLKGEMSLVGPRPLPSLYLGRYSLEQARRLDVKPGVTGWSQVNGRNNISWNEKLRLDVWYVDNIGFWLDLKILALTVIKVLRRDDISRDGFATGPTFMGNDEKEK